MVAKASGPLRKNAPAAAVPTAVARPVPTASLTTVPATSPRVFSPALRARISRAAVTTPPNMAPTMPMVAMAPTGRLVSLCCRGYC